MPVKVLLRGFAPDIPEDQPATFSNDLPESILCIECNNVSSKLYRDPHGHGYCETCKGMRQTENGFFCWKCDEHFNVEKLVIDETIRSKLGKEMVICPDTTESETIEIPFSALKTYLKGISCEFTSRALSPGKDDDGIQPKAMNPQSCQMSTCVICKQTMQKKFLTQHIKICLKDVPVGRAGHHQDKGNAQQVQCKPAGLTRKVECPLCGSLQDRKAVGMHMSEECPKRVVQCNLCNADVEVSQKEAHESSCRHRPGTCEHCLKQFPTTAELEDDHHPKCPEMPVRCSFHELGCTFVAARRELPAHEGTATHAGMLVRHICLLKAENESLRRTIGKQEDTYRKTTEKMKDSQNDIALLKATVSALQEDNTSFQRTSTEKDNDIDCFQENMSALQEDVQRFQRTIEEKDNDIQLLKVTVSALQDDLKKENVQRLEETMTALQGDVKSLQTEWENEMQRQTKFILALKAWRESFEESMAQKDVCTIKNLEYAIKSCHEKYQDFARIIQHQQTATLRCLEEQKERFKQMLQDVHRSRLGKI